LDFVVMMFSLLSQWGKWVPYKQIHYVL
jgi:hypothetical protein